MNKYLDGYIASIPRIEHDNIVLFLKEYAINTFNLSEDDFENLIDEVINIVEPTPNDYNVDLQEKPKETYNRFYSKVGLDLTYIYKIINVIHTQIEGYSYLSSAYFSDINSELNRLRVEYDKMKRIKDLEKNTVIINDNFLSTRNFEEYNETTKYLFVGRKNEQIVPVELVSRGNKSIISLAIEEEKDLLHNKNNKTTAMIQVIDYRGIPIEAYIGPEAAIDNSEISYWDVSTYTKIPLHIPMDDLPAGGAYIKFKIILSNIERISEISITPYSVYPVEIAKITIDGTDITKSTVNPVTISNDTMIFNIEPLVSDEIEIILRQKNYIKTTTTENSKRDEAAELWNRAFDINKISEVDHELNMYKKYSKKKSKEIIKWNESYIKNKTEREVDLDE